MRRNTVNLLPKSEFEVSFWGRFLKWALSAGRYIIIVTELVVISAFFSRFWLDQTMSDLTDAVMNKRLILNATAGIEKNFREVQTRLGTARNRIDKQISVTQLLDSLTRIRPVGVNLVDAQLHQVPGQEGQLVIRAQAVNEQDVGVFVRLMANEVGAEGQKLWKNISLVNIESTEATGVEFGLTANY